MLLLKRCPETKDNDMFLDVLSSDIYFQKSNPEKKSGREWYQSLFKIVKIHLICIIKE